MADLNVFGYRHGISFAHRLDVRCKLVCLLLMTWAVAAAAPLTMGPFTLVMFFLWCRWGLPLRSLGAELAGFGCFFLLVFAVRAAATPGEALLTIGPLVVTRQGLQAGGIMVWRLAMILVLSLMFIITTRPVHLKAAVQWLLGPVPFVPARRAATMVGLLVRFIPVLHQQVHETRNALRARSGLRPRLSPRGLRFLILPTLRRMMLAADQLSLAMAARGYQEARTDPDLRAGPRDAAALSVAVALCLLILTV